MPTLSKLLAISAFIAIPGLQAARAQSTDDIATLKKELQQLKTRVDQLENAEAEAATTPSPATTEQNKILLNSGVTQLKLYGDLRFRYQYDQFHPEVNTPELVTTDRDRYRFRLRIGADIQLGDQFFAGVTLATGQAADSNNQTYTEGYDNYSIYLYKAYAGWTPSDWLTIILGKQSNPFYTTDLVWSPDITPTGAVEVLDLSKAFLPDSSRFSLQLISMQGIFEGADSFTTGRDSAWQFVEQLRGTWRFNKDTSITFAPGFMVETGASLTGLQNSQPFDKPADQLPAPLGVQTQTTTTNTATETVKYAAGTGEPSITYTPVNTTTTVTITDPATGAVRTVTTTTTNNQRQVTIPFGAKGNPLPANKALANQTFVYTKTSGGGTTTVTSPTGQEPPEETKDLAILTAPGDISFKLGSIPTKVYWDLAYNTEGGERATDEYFLTSHSAQDDFAWLAGVQFGNNIHAGDWSLYANYRQVGMDSIDPNLNDSNFALSYLNVQGFKIGLAYNFTESLVGAVTYFGAWNLRGITGGEATEGAQLGNAKSVNVLQVDMNLKF